MLSYKFMCSKCVLESACSFCVHAPLPSSLLMLRVYVHTPSFSLLSLSLCACVPSCVRVL